MTFQGLHDLIFVLADKEGSDWFPAAQVDSVANIAQDRYVDDCYAQFEMNERIRQEMAPIVNKAPAFSATSTINLTSITNLRYVLSVSCIINKTDIFGQVTAYESPALPRSLDKFEKNLFNSFTKPLEDYPVYEEYFDTGVNQHILKIYSNGVTPTSTTVFFMRNPTTIDAANNPSSSMDFSDNVCRKIAFMAVETLKGIIEDYQGTNEERIAEKERA